MVSGRVRRRSKIYLVDLVALLFVELFKNPPPEYCHEFLGGAVTAETQMDEAIVDKLRQGMEVSTMKLDGSLDNRMNILYSLFFIYLDIEKEIFTCML